MEKKNEKAVIPGRKGAIARLVVLCGMVLIALLSSIGTLPGYIQKQGVGRAVLEAVAGCGAIFLVGAFVWGLMKWIAVVAPKAYRFANRFWQAWRPLTLFGLYIKAVLWLILLVVPCSIFGLLFSPMYSLIFRLGQDGLGFFCAVGLFLAGAVLVSVVGFVDVCKLQQLPVMETAKCIVMPKK